MSTKKSPLESVIVKRILRRLRSRGGFWVKTHGDPRQQAGLPDIIGCYLGRYIAFEVKRDAAGKLTDLQAYTLKRIRTAGGVAIRIHTVEQAEAIIDRLDELQVAKARKRKLKPPQSGD